MRLSLNISNWWQPSIQNLCLFLKICHEWQPHLECMF